MFVKWIDVDLKRLEKQIETNLAYKNMLSAPPKQAK